MTAWWRGWTPTGAVVTLTSALGTLLLLGTGCWLCLRGHVDDGLQVLAFGGFSGMATNSVAARTRPDPGQDSPQPVAVQQPPGQPVPVDTTADTADDGPTFPAA